MSELVILIEPVRHFLGSVIGASKMLHFVNPGVFPTWNTVIHRYCRRPEQISATDSLKNYVEYTFCVHRLINHPDLRPESTHRCCKPMEEAYSVIRDQYRTPEPMGRACAAEFIMFFGGKAEPAAALSN